jgi:hypothetical protein
MGSAMLDIGKEGTMEVKEKVGSVEADDAWPTLVGLPAFSEDGATLGDVSGVLLERDTGAPDWVIVAAASGSRYVVPFRNALIGERDVRVAYPRARVEASGPVGSGEISARRQAELSRHYGLVPAKQPSSAAAAGVRRAQTGGRRDRRRNTGPTRDELYAEARKLGIEGRSKMKKAELARAVERARGRSRGNVGVKAHPVEVQRFLEGVGYPTGKRDLVREAESQGAGEDVRRTLERLPDGRFESPTDVSEAIGGL